MIPNASGGIIDDTMITKLSNAFGYTQCLYQVVNAGCADKDLRHLYEHLDAFRTAGHDVKLEVHWVQERGLFALQGPKAAAVFEQATGKSVDGIAFGESFWGELEGAKVLVGRCGYTGEDGFELFVPGDKAEAVWDRLLQFDDVRAAGLGVRDALRLEAGRGCDFASGRGSKICMMCGAPSGNIRTRLV